VPPSGSSVRKSLAKAHPIERQIPSFNDELEVAAPAKLGCSLDVSENGRESSLGQGLAVDDVRPVQNLQQGLRRCSLGFVNGI